MMCGVKRFFQGPCIWSSIPEWYQWWASNGGRYSGPEAGASRAPLLALSGRESALSIGMRLSLEQGDSGSLMKNRELGGGACVSL